MRWRWPIGLVLALALGILVGRSLRSLPETSIQLVARQLPSSPALWLPLR